MKQILIFTILIFFSCSNRKTYNVIGTLLDIRSQTNQFVIHHDEIPNFMMAMTMPFTLLDSSDIYKYRVGDSLIFKLVIENEKAYAKDFKYQGKGTIPRSSDIFYDEYAPISIGEIFDDVELLNTDSNAINLSSSDGKFRFISFIFTRCPVPTMCPAIVVKNQYLSQAFIDENKIEFFLVSFDYIFDTPSILNKSYGSLIESNPNIKLFSSIGKINAIFKLAGQSNISFWGVDENDIGHTLRSILIDPERRLMKAFDGTNWNPELAERSIKNIMKAYSY